MGKEGPQDKDPIEDIATRLKGLLDPLFNIDKIGERPIVNVEVDKEENSDVNHGARHIIKMMQDWIKKPFKLDPIPETIIFHAQARPTKGRWKNFTIPTFAAQSPIMPATVYQLDRLVEYYYPQERKGKGKRKRSSPQRVEPQEGKILAPPQQEEENVQGSKDTGASQVQDDPQLPLVAAPSQMEIEVEVQEVSLPRQIE